MPERARTRTFSSRYTLDILNRYESLNKQGQGALLRREGRYRSLLSEWRKQRDKGALEALSLPRGRPRRCGWFDSVAGRHAVQVNGFDSIALTRLDILDAFDQIRVCVAYDLDGERIDAFSSIPSVLARWKPIYEDLPGWQTSLEGCTRFEDPPPAARAYVERLEALLDAPIDLISVGADREQTIARRPVL